VKLMAMNRRLSRAYPLLLGFQADNIPEQAVKTAGR